MIQELRAHRYDLAVDLLFNPRSAWLLRLAGIPLRIGGTAGSRRRLYTHVLPRSRVEDPRGVLARLAPGGLGDHLCRLAPLVHRESGQGFLAWLADAVAGPVAPLLTRPSLGAAARRALGTVGVDPDEPFVVAAPGATWPAKEWPAEHWTRLLAGLPDRGYPPVAVLVPPGQQQRWGRLPRALPALPLAEVLGLLAAARAVVAVDGGVMHAAVGFGVPVLALFGPTDPAAWFPYEAATPSRVLATRPACHPCDRHVCPAAEFVCLPGLEPGAVENALGALLEAAPAAGGGGA
jgi:ADP-heptose:LPS heptosyltransferase